MDGGTAIHSVYGLIGIATVATLVGAGTGSYFRYWYTAHWPGWDNPVRPALAPSWPHRLAQWLLHQV